MFLFGTEELLYTPKESETNLQFEELKPDVSRA
jgi:hypothetical protein